MFLSCHAGGDIIYRSQCSAVQNELECRVNWIIKSASAIAIKNSRFLWESRENWNGHSVVRKRECMELLHGNGKEWEKPFLQTFTVLSSRNCGYWPTMANSQTVQ